MSDNSDKLWQLWEQARANPNTPVDIGQIVVCDFCDKDWTDSGVSGGILFQSKAVCPDCTPRILKSVRDHGEEEFIRGTCPPGQAFADYIRALRGGDNTIAFYDRSKP